MSPEKQRIAIAEACGWKCISEKVCPPEDRVSWGTIPDYLNDLNAVHEAEKTLAPTGHYNGGNSGLFRYWLRKVTGSETGMVHATAAQRAEAFLRTIGKWEDDS